MPPAPDTESSCFGSPVRRTFAPTSEARRVIHCRFLVSTMPASSTMISWLGLTAAMGVLTRWAASLARRNRRSMGLFDWLILWRSSPCVWAAS